MQKNNKYKFIVIVLILLATNLFGCDLQSSETKSSTVEKQLNKQENTIPTSFTKENIKNAFAEYINYRMWLYPINIKENEGTSLPFDSYVNKSIEVEIRLYSDELSDGGLYIHTNIDDKLVSLKEKDGVIYCDGVLKTNSTDWPKGEYTVIDKYSYVIPAATKPDYGMSDRKQKMIEAIETEINKFCNDQSNAGNENMEVYISNFYEYEEASQVWIVKKSGEIISYPISLQEESNGFITSVPMIETYKNISEFGDWYKHIYERNITDAIKHYLCTLK